MSKGEHHCKRIFWLGMHKVLVQTELVRLRILGYEVFNPPYLSPIQDQSAHLDWDNMQQSSLPREVFEKLANYNFFYNEISSEIAEILNRYFDAVIVTISPRWLRAIIRVYHGRLIFRTYGQHYKLSDELRREGILFDIAGRDNFTFMPHAAEALYGEHSWLKDCAEIVPYCLPPDIYNSAGEWTGPIASEDREIIVSCPNIDNPFFRDHYDFLKKNFSDSHFKYYGVQLSKILDKQVVGTLSREELLSSYKQASGYLYTYSDIRVCYLPPLEMMVLGGPVLFLKGSLLDKYFEVDAPGRCENIQEAKIKVARLLNQDQEFLDSLLNSQSKVVYRYHPDYVWPLFDEKLDQIFKQERPPQAWLSKVPSYETDAKRIYLFQHFPGQPITFDGTSYSAYDGIPRVMRQIVTALCRDESIEVWVTARYDQAESFYGYFSSSLHTSNKRIKILVIDDNDNNHGSSNAAKVKQIVKNIFPERYWPTLLKVLSVSRRVRAFIKQVSSKNSHRPSSLLRHITQINNDSNCSYVIVPHYYWFPEALYLNKDIYFYLPDYMPYFFHNTGEFVEDEGSHTDIGRAIAAKAKVIFCNSEFTKEYLPKSRLKVNPEKIRVFYLPVLNAVSSSTDVALPIALQPCKYIFYPTQPRPNKNLSFLLTVFESLVQRGYDLKLVLTCELNPDPKALLVFNKMSCPERVVFLPHVSDAQLSVLYKNAALLCFTSLAEGNFPPQMQEAVFYETPIVAVNLGFITERIPYDLSDSLFLCEANDHDGYVKACEFVLNNRVNVLAKQAHLREVLLSYDTDNFQNSISLVFR